MRKAPATSRPTARRTRPATGADEILKSDWNAIRDAGFRLVNAFAGPAAERRSARAALRHLLADLRSCYGRTPGLLATEADLLATGAPRLALWREAYRKAIAADDHKNALLIASSLADYWTDERKRLREGRHWVARMKAHLRKHPDRLMAEEAADLSTRLAAMARR